MNKELANLLFPAVEETIEDLKNKYPARGGAALRLAPSPTGFMHIGGVWMGLCVTRLAKSLGGISYLRIEDTDQKREVAGAAEMLRKDLAGFGIEFDEYDDVRGNSVGQYGPYTQSRRIGIYHVFAKHLVEVGRAYPCFCTPVMLQNMRKWQEKEGMRTGYNASVSRCRGLSLDDVRAKISAGEDWVLRFDTTEDAGQKIEWEDLIRGKISLPAEENHPIIIKANGLPPYNFGHVVDDTMMRTSHILRGEEWLVSAAEHIQIATSLGGVPYLYAHMPTISILDNGNKRKLSKRKDKEAAAQTFIDMGYPIDAVIEYLITLANSDFETWRSENPDKHHTEFEFKFEKISRNNPLFDWAKLDSIAKEKIAKMTIAEINANVREFFKDNPTVIGKMAQVEMMLAIGRETEKPRKDLAKYTDILSEYNFIFEKPVMPVFSAKEQKMVNDFAKIYSSADDKETWLGKLKSVAEKHGYVNVKMFKDNPEKYKGNTGDAAKIFSRALIGKEQSPDLYTVMKIMLGGKR